MSAPLSVYLCGFMGCGKSHIGRLLAAALNRRFLDLDRYIVNAEGMTIPEIFDKYGEPHFRQLEAKYIRELSDGSIVATGGGALINAETAKFARESGLSVYINTSFEVCYKRIKGDANRPLVVNNTPEQLRELYNKRAEIYKQNAVCMVNGNTRDTVITEEIVKLVKFHEK
ncbi:MAG: shikimate kinase [Lachnospiraceae bacterium]|nr:shikimate kinase [Ruminococcus sp.]MCM1274174.1 shikimate kinase [Lachnospiraceae bacterium]